MSNIRSQAVEMGPHLSGEEPEEHVAFEVLVNSEESRIRRDRSNSFYLTQLMS